MAIFAAKCMQMLHRLHRLDALGNGLQTEIVRHVNDGAHDAGVAAMRIDATHEAAVYFQVIELKALQIAQRRIAGSEIIEQKRAAQRAQAGYQVAGECCDAVRVSPIGPTSTNEWLL